jgi:hypothetical protein
MIANFSARPRAADSRELYSTPPLGAVCAVVGTGTAVAVRGIKCAAILATRVIITDSTPTPSCMSISID